MATVTKYSDLQKLDPGGQYRFFQAVRAVGLSVEVGHKAAKAKGLGKDGPSDVNLVRVSGSLRVLEDGRWRRVVACSLRLGPAEVALALALVRQQRDLLADFRLNIWTLDIQRRVAKGSFDMLGDFCGDQNWGVTGRVWVELKVYSATSFGDSVQKAKDELETGLREERPADPSLGAALLLAAQVELQGGTWKVLSMLALLKPVASGWKCVAGKQKTVARGQSKQKPPMAEVLQNMEWVRMGSGETVRYLKDFLAAVQGFQKKSRGDPKRNPIHSRRQTSVSEELGAGSVGRWRHICFT